MVAVPPVDLLTADGFVLEEEPPEPRAESIADFVFGEEYRARIARSARERHRERVRLVREARLASQR